ncbi:MFS transporter [Saccharomonospora xinjiangensis]|uniref:Arabinose efflux permease family protein n=1 Tax=Saccharomonospora xinjiangensis XJ-54 TaxID=882086 RepID=I0V2I4_9PSEU|nr:MFS transporter [Saccharomonospora xinjiangensis]EID54337.1 arabinose efflux permease family protein [Saccharomonospora xinjiangensis XJ-54]
MSLLAGFLDARPLRGSAAFRRLLVSSSFSTIGHQLAVVAVLAQVWDLTANPVAVGVVGLAQAVPMVVCGLVGGVLADVLDRRKLVLVTTAVQALAAAGMAVQALAEVSSLALVLALVATQFAFAGLGSAARKTFVVTLLPEGQVSAGLAWTNLSFQVAMLAGPALGGVVTSAWGVGACYAADAATLLVAAYGVLRLPPMRRAASKERQGPRSIVVGLAFVVRSPVVAGALLTDVFATVLAMPIALFPAINDERFAGDPATLGLFLSAIAVGGTAAGLLSGSFTRLRRLGVVQLVAAMVWAAALTTFGLAQPLWLALVLLAVAGAADTVSVITRGALVQLATPDSHRGRVSGVENVIGIAGPDLGNFRAGAVAGFTSPGFAAASGGLLCLVCLGVLALGNAPLRRFTTGVRQPEAVG